MSRVCGSRKRLKPRRRSPRNYDVRADLMILKVTGRRSISRELPSLMFPRTNSAILLTWSRAMGRIPKASRKKKWLKWIERYGPVVFVVAAICLTLLWVGLLAHWLKELV